MSPNSVSALAYRAREGLRLAYVQGHLAPPLDDGCRRTTSQLAAYVRKGLSRRETAAVDEHLDRCARCTALYLELVEVNSNLSGLLVPALLGTAAAGYLTSGGSMATGHRQPRRRPREPFVHHRYVCAGRSHRGRCRCPDGGRCRGGLAGRPR